MTGKKAAAGDKVKVEYTGTLDSGETFDSSEGREPLEFEVGSGQVIAGFDSAVVGMSAGEEKTIKIESADAYGERVDQMIQKVPLDRFPPEVKLKPGDTLRVMTPDGIPMIINVVSVDSEGATVDFNHPLAGKNLNFKIKLVSIA